MFCGLFYIWNHVFNNQIVSDIKKLLSAFFAVLGSNKLTFPIEKYCNP